MSTTRILIVSQVMMAVVLSLTAARTFATGSDRGGAPAAATALGGGFTFQGRLEIDGVPANGTCSFEFGLFDAELGGVQLGSTQSATLTVNNGAFAALLNNSGQFGASPFTGDERWLQVGAGCSGPIHKFAGRTLLAATPYALGLRPGAAILGNQAAATLSLENSAQLGTGLFIGDTRTAVSITNPDTGVFIDNPDTGLFVKDPTDYGVRISDSASHGVFITGAVGDGVNATSTSASAAGGRFVNTASGGVGLFAKGGAGNSSDIVLGGTNQSDNGGRISSDPAFAGSDLFFFSEDQIFLDFRTGDNEIGNVIVREGTTQVFEIRDNGNVRQADTAFGLPKLAALVNCSQVSGMENFHTTRMGATAPTVTDQNQPGECSVDLGFDASNSYIQLTAVSGSARTVTYTLAAGGTVLNIFRWDADTGTGSNGDVSLLIY